MAGRERILTKEKIENFSNAIYLGAPKKLAATYIGVSESSVMHWLQIGRDERERIANNKRPIKKNSLYLEFLQSVEKAESDLGIELLQEIQDARSRRDIASSWRMLSSKYREFATANNLDVTSDGEKIELVVKYADTDDKPSATP